MLSKRTTRPWSPAIGLVALAVALAASLAAAPSRADVINGDFENGGSDWSPNLPPDWSAVFPPAGGNPDGYAMIRSPFAGPGGIGCIIQTFLCGEPEGGTECTIGFDYRLEQIDASPGSARIKVLIDGAESVVTDVPTDWASISYVVPCGVHVMALCLEVDPENNSWVASFDNVRAECTGSVPVDASTWTSLKGMFR
ncbi:MAG TPA: hypothetical protein PLL30_01080 [Candidatus Krumholzibacteria bacterium]|nr:hypothetical protein [Candidatus Krumholzibacteria bacterium]HPD70355.1 hypothetical protein [Candidatus Krumholzibacteria bacterium]HRY39945.1 hypothetical protein [Candidatus Krumholzibacteria bacterium]